MPLQADNYISARRRAAGSIARITTMCPQKAIRLFFLTILRPWCALQVDFLPCRMKPAIPGFDVEKGEKPREKAV